MNRYLLTSAFLAYQVAAQSTITAGIPYGGGIDGGNFINPDVSHYASLKTTILDFGTTSSVLVFQCTPRTTRKQPSEDSCEDKSGARWQYTYTLAPGAFQATLTGLIRSTTFQKVYSFAYEANAKLSNAPAATSAVGNVTAYEPVCAGTLTKSDPITIPVMNVAVTVTTFNHSERTLPSYSSTSLKKRDDISTGHGIPLTGDPFTRTPYTGGSLTSIDQACSIDGLVFPKDKNGTVSTVTSRVGVAGGMSTPSTSPASVPASITPSTTSPSTTGGTSGSSRNGTSFTAGPRSGAQSLLGPDRLLVFGLAMLSVFFGNTGMSRLVFFVLVLRTIYAQSTISINVPLPSENDFNFFDELNFIPLDGPNHYIASVAASDATATTLVLQCIPQGVAGLHECEDQKGARYQKTVTVGPSSFGQHKTYSLLIPGERTTLTSAIHNYEFAYTTTISASQPTAPIFNDPTTITRSDPVFVGAETNIDPIIGCVGTLTRVSAVTFRATSIDITLTTFNHTERTFIPSSITTNPALTQSHTFTNPYKSCVVDGLVFPRDTNGTITTLTSRSGVFGNMPSSQTLISTLPTSLTTTTGVSPTGNTGNAGSANGRSSANSNSVDGFLVCGLALFVVTLSAILLL